MNSLVNYFPKDRLKKTNHKANFRANSAVFAGRGQIVVTYRSILEDKQLSFQARLLFQIILTLSFKEGYCYASNPFLADKLGVSVSSIKRYITELLKEKMIRSEITTTKVGSRRDIIIDFHTLRRRYTRIDKRAIHAEQVKVANTPYKRFKS